MKIAISACAWLGGKILFEAEVSDSIVPTLRVRAALELAVKARADLRGTYLSGAYLRGADLRGADLIGADLSGADLRGTYLSGADLSGADLRGTYLSGADLSGADLSGADLIGADLSGADLRGADLSGADLRGTYLSGKKLVGKRPYLAIGPLGSREAYLYAYITKEGLYVEAGCFFGTRDEFATKVEEHHGENEHGQEYRAALALIDVHAKIWTPTVEQIAADDAAAAERQKEWEAKAAQREEEARAKAAA